MKQYEKNRRLGAKIGTLRREMGTSQEKFSGLIGCTTAHLSKIERGEKVPSLNLLFSIADHLQVPLATMFDSTAEKDSDSIQKIRGRLNALLNITTPEKAQLMLKVCQLIHASSR